MSAYNRLNGHYCSGNTYLLMDILKNRWGFLGFVMSDWGAVHSTIPDLYAGTDIEMPTDRYFTVQAVIAAIHEGAIKESKLNDKIRRILRAMFAMGYFDQRPIDQGALDTPAHRQLARTVAQEGIVLLKNQNNLLPLNRNKIKSIAVIGPNAAVAITGGGGSSFVSPFYSVSPLQGIQANVGKRIAVRYARDILQETNLTPIPTENLRPPQGGEGKYGLLAEYFNNMTFSGDPVIRHIDPQINFNVGDGKVDERINEDWTANCGWIIGGIMPLSRKPIRSNYKLEENMTCASNFMSMVAAPLQFWAGRELIHIKPPNFSWPNGKRLYPSRKIPILSCSASATRPTLSPRVKIEAISICQKNK